MTVQLTVAVDRYGTDPVYCPEKHALNLSDYALFDQMKAEAQPLPRGVVWYGDEGCENHTTDPYGQPLKYLPAAALARYLDAALLRGFDLAIRAYVNALPPDARVVLWWN